MAIIRQLSFFDKIPEEDLGTLIYLKKLVQERPDRGFLENISLRTPALKMSEIHTRWNLLFSLFLYRLRTIDNLYRNVKRNPEMFAFILHSEPERKALPPPEDAVSFALTLLEDQKALNEVLDLLADFFSDLSEKDQKYLKQGVRHLTSAVREFNSLN